MIELKVHNYCHNCPDFKPVSTSSAFVGFHEELYNTHVIICVHHERCKKIKEYLEKQGM